MPINLARDTALALGEFAGACECRSLLQQRFVFCQTDLDAARRLALDLWVDKECTDVIALREQAKADAERREERYGKDNAEARKLRSLQSLADRMAKGYPTWRLRPPSRQWFPPNQPGHRSFKLTSRQPLAIGLATGAWENSGLMLHRRFGYPFIPGSALKGLALRGALDLQADPALQRAVLGDAPDQQSESPGRAGAASFLDAVAEQSEVRLDIVTPHYGNYYSESTRAPNPNALDTEQPKPNVFPVVAPGAHFRFDLLLLPCRDQGRFTADQLLTAAQEWLTHALSVFGIGSKSRAGYGRFGILKTGGAGNALFPPSVADQTKAVARPEGSALPAADACLARWRGNVPTFAFAMGPFIAELAALGDADLRRVARELIKPAHWRASGLPANPTTNPYWIEFAKAAGGGDVLRRLGQSNP